MNKRKQLIVLFLFVIIGIQVCGAQTNKRTRFHVQGIVTDATGVDLVGATVSARSNGKIVGVTVTNEKGEYSIDVPASESQLEFTYLGYLKNIQRVADKHKISVVMTSDSKALDDVVVTGYQTLSKERVTGAFSKVDMEKLSQKRYSSLSSLLEGEVAGYNTTSNLIRGTTTMNGVTNPLYVIDGFPIENTRYNSSGSLVENIPDINLEDIESITILKDAAAASIYGARAANGVIVIVTKKAKRGKTNISFSSSFTIHPYYFYKDRLANSADMIDLEKEWATDNQNLQGSGAKNYAQSLLQNNLYTSQGIQAILNCYAGNTTQAQETATLSALAGKGYRFYDDVAKYAKRTALYQQYNLSLGKASENNNFMASISLRNNQLNDKYSDNNSIGIDLKNSMDITPWLKFDVGSYTYYNREDVQTYDAMNPGYSYMPYDGLKNDDGTNHTSTAASRYSQSTMNIINNNSLYSLDITPLDELGRNLQHNHNFISRDYAKLGITFTPYLKYNVMFEYEYGSDHSKLMYDKNSYYVRNLVDEYATASASGTVYNIPYGDILYRQNQTSNSYTFRQQLNFDKTFAGKNDITILAGQEIRQGKLDYSNQTLYNYDPDMLTFSLIDASALSKISGLMGGYSFSQNNIAYDRYSDNRFVSFYGNAAYSYDSRYMFSSSIRWDRSDLWGTNSKYQNKPIWSVGGGWNINRESFFKLSWVDRLKLRFSYGIGGNIAKNAAPYMTASYSQNNNVGGEEGTISSRPNPNLRWEKTTTTNIGIDFSLLKSRLSGSIDIYNKMGTDLLANTMGVPTEGYGYSTYMINNGKMRNRGVELTLNGDLIQTHDFDFGATATYSYNKNKVIYVNVTAPMYILQMDYPTSYPRVGKPYSSIYAYKWAGLSSTGLPQVYDAQGNVTTNYPSDINAVVYAGTTEPTTNASLNLSLRYKDFDFSCLFIYKGGYKVRNTDLPMLGSSYSSLLGSYITSIAPVNKRITNRWKVAGDEKKTNVPRAVFGESSDYNYSSALIYDYADLNVIDASNLRLSNMSLAYHLPVTLIHKILLSDARVQFNIENVMTIAHSSAAKYMLGGYDSPNYVFGLYFNF